MHNPFQVFASDYSNVSRRTRKTLYGMLHDANLQPRLVNSMTSITFVDDTREPFAVEQSPSTYPSQSELASDMKHDAQDTEAKQSQPSKPVIVTVTDQDPVDLANLCLSQFRERPCLHYPAHVTSVGGEWWKERSDYETDVILRSTLMVSLDNFGNHDFQRRWKYPLAPFNMLMVPDVLFFRDAQGNDYDAKNCVWLTTLVSGVRPMPYKRANNTLRPCDVRIIVKTYEAVFKLAKAKGLESVILYGLVGIDDHYGYPVSEIFKCVKQALKTCPVNRVYVSVPTWSKEKRDSLQGVLDGNIAISM